MLAITKNVSFPGMIDFLRFAKGVDVISFNARSGKSLRQLHEQITTRDVKMLILGEEDFPSVPEELFGRVLLVRRSVKVHIDAEGYELLETMRVYNIQGKDVPDPVKENFALSESLMFGEPAVDGTLRALSHEMKMHFVSPTQLKEHNTPDEVGLIRKSRTYDGILAQDIIRRVDFTLLKRRWKEGKKFKDSGVWIHLNWFLSNSK